MKRVSHENENQWNNSVWTELLAIILCVKLNFFPLIYKWNKQRPRELQQGWLEVWFGGRIPTYLPNGSRGWGPTTTGGKGQPEPAQRKHLLWDCRHEARSLEFSHCALQACASVLVWCLGVPEQENKQWQVCFRIDSAETCWCVYVYLVLSVLCSEGVTETEEKSQNKGMELFWLKGDSDSESWLQVLGLTTANKGSFNRTSSVRRNRKQSFRKWAVLAFW